MNNRTINCKFEMQSDNVVYRFNIDKPKNMENILEECIKKLYNIPVFDGEYNMDIFVKHSRYFAKHSQYSIKVINYGSKVIYKYLLKNYNKTYKIPLSGPNNIVTNKPDFYTLDFENEEASKAYQNMKK